MRKKSIAFAGVLLDITMFCVGFFFLYWGAWNILFGSAVPGMAFGIFMVVFGAAMVGLVVVVALRLYAFLRSQSKKSSSATWKLVRKEGERRFLFPSAILGT